MSVTPLGHGGHQGFDYGEPHGSPHIHPPPPMVHHKEDDDKDKKKPKKAEKIHQVKESVSPDIKVKLREMLTTELNKKLDELDLVPSSITKSTDATIKGKETGDPYRSSQESSGSSKQSSTEFKQGSSNPNAYSDSSKQSSSSISNKQRHNQGTSGKMNHQQNQFSSNEESKQKGSSNPNNNETDDTTTVLSVDEEKIPSAKKVKNANSQFGDDSSSSSGSSSSSNDQMHTDQIDFLEEKSLLAQGIRKAKGNAVTGVLRSKGTEKKSDRCKRYRILKNGKKLKLKFSKKDCVESV